MLDNRLRTILDCLSENEFVSMDTICKRTQRSEKTIRKQLTELGGILGKNGAELVRKYGKGYQIVVQDAQVYSQFRAEEKPLGYYDTSEERTRYILSVLLLQNEFIKIEDLCEKLFASRKTISNDLRHIDDYLKGYDLVLDRKPYPFYKVYEKQCVTEETAG